MDKKQSKENNENIGVDGTVVENGKYKLKKITKTLESMEPLWKMVNTSNFLVNTLNTIIFFFLYSTILININNDSVSNNIEQTKITKQTWQ